MDIYGLCLSHQDMDREYRYQLTLCLHQEPQYAVEQFPLLQEQHFGKEITQSEAKANSPNSNSKFDKFIFLNKSNGSMSLRAEQCQLHPPCRYGSILFKLWENMSIHVMTVCLALNTLLLIFLLSFCFSWFFHPFDGFSVTLTLCPLASASFVAAGHALVSHSKRTQLRPRNSRFPKFLLNTKTTRHKKNSGATRKGNGWQQNLKDMWSTCHNVNKSVQDSPSLFGFQNSVTWPMWSRTWPR